MYFVLFFFVAEREKKNDSLKKNSKKEEKEKKKKGIYTSFPFASDQIYLCCANKILDFLILLMATHTRIVHTHTPTPRFFPFLVRF